MSKFSLHPESAGELMSEEFLTGRQIGERFCVSPETVRLWGKRGLLRRYVISRRVIRYLRADVERLLSGDIPFSEKSGD